MSPMPEIEQRFLDSPACNFVSITTVLSRVVTQEKNSRTAAHTGRTRSVVKATEMGTWFLGVQLGHPAPGGYKYGGLALQVGGWATGRRPVTL